MPSPIPHVPMLIGTGDSPLAKQHFPLGSGYRIVGRQPGCWLYLDDPRVSSRHAALTVNGGVWVQDLDSGGGTWVNGEEVVGSRQLQPADLLRVGPFTLRFELARHGSAPGTTFVTQGDLSADAINMVGRDQITIHRDSLLRDIAATRTRAWRLIIAGFVLWVLGAGLFAAGVLRFMAQLAGSAWRPPRNPFGAEILGIPSGLIGWAANAIGTILIIVGIVLHVIAVARRRQLDRDLSDPRRR